MDLRSLTDGTIVFSGIGASAHALTPAVLALRAAGRRAFAISPQELKTARASALGDAFVLVSQSGASVETVEALAHLDGARVVAISAIDASGGGVAAASAGETARLAREALRVPAAGMETREYLHGPLEAIDDGFGCVVFGRERELELAAELASFGAAVTLVSDQGAPPEPMLHSIRTPSVAPLATPVLQILPVQLLVDHVARLRGLEVRDLRRHQPDTKVV